MQEVATSVWALRRERGPRVGVRGAFVGVEFVFRRLEEEDLREVGRREGGASGPEDLDVLQRPMVPSAEAERMRLDGAWTARQSTEARWP